MVSALLAAAILAAPSSGTCAATTVRYQSMKFPGFSDTPWVLARPQGPGVLVSLPNYPQSLRDGRVNRSDGLVLWTRGATVIWSQPGSVVAQRLDRPGRFRVGSELRFPRPGCWRLTHRDGSTSVSVVARVVAPPKAGGCAASPLESGWAVVRPRSSGIGGGWGPWRTSSNGALLYTHGHGAGLNMKVPWWIRRSWGPSLELAGTRLDADGTFQQVFGMAGSPQGVFPSTVDVPAAGCWLFRLRSARLAGVLVVRVVDDHG